MKKAVVTIDVENLLALVEESNYAESKYQKANKMSYLVSNRGEYIQRAWNDSIAADSQLYAIYNVLNMDGDCIRRLRVASRAVEKWRKKTDYRFLIPGKTQTKLINFIFGDNGCVVVKKFLSRNEFEREIF